MKYAYAGPEVESGVTHERLALYRTTETACKCPANTCKPGPCKYIKAARHGCSCPETLRLVRPDRGAVLVCAEDRCEYGRIRVQALLNDGWTEVPEGASYKVCFVCEMEIVPNVTPAATRMRYCYKGEHWLQFVCGICGELAAGIDEEDAPACNAHFQPAELPVAV